MKGTIKALKRAPQSLGSRVGMASKSQDAEFNELNRKFTGLEDYTTKLIKDTAVFREAIASMLTTQANFGTAFSTLFQPLPNETSLSYAHPESAQTLKSIVIYQDAMNELRDVIQPELDLIDGRVIAPLKEYGDLLKKVRKTITKRDHKLVDYDRFNNSFSKLKDKKEKSLSDEKNLFKLEQDLEQATAEYDHYNNSLKDELPHLLALTTAFITPLFQTFYFVKVGILYTLLEKMQGFQGENFGELPIEHLEEMHASKIGDTQERIESLTVSKRFVGTARLMSAHRQGQADAAAAAPVRAPYVPAARAPSSYAKSPPPPPVASPYAAAPPPYVEPATAPSIATKRAPPPPPAPKPRPKPPIVPRITYVTALYDYAATAEGDLSFVTGDKIELIKRGESVEDWWTGKLDGVEGVFPGNYVQS